MGAGVTAADSGLVSAGACVSAGAVVSGALVSITGIVVSTLAGLTGAADSTGLAGSSFFSTTTGAAAGVS